jgi:hypothetical protein
MPRVGFEPTIPVFERVKTVHAADREATVIGSHLLTCTVSYFMSVSNVLRFHFFSIASYFISYILYPQLRQNYLVYSNAICL